MANLRINDVAITEGNAGTQMATFTVLLDAPAGPGGVTFNIATADNTATAGSDYVARSLTGQTIAAGSSTYTFNVTINGDTTFEPNESFFVNVSNVVGATVADAQGQGTITNDDIQPPPSTVPTPGPDQISGGNGPDTISGLAGDDSIDGLGAGDLLFGNEGADTIAGREGDNTIAGGQDSSDAADLITAGGGNDLIFGNGGADTILGGGGANTIVGGFGRDTIAGGAGDDIILSSQDNDTVDAGEGANIVVGGLGNDSIVTGIGNDTIFGSEGDDSMAGGAGADRYVFLAGSGNDQINGFSGSGEGDRLDLSGQTFTTGTSADGDVVLLLSGGGTIELNGVAPGSFSPGFVA